MTAYAEKIMEIKQKIVTAPEYRFLYTNPHLNHALVMLGLGGSYAYGTYTDSSDIDIRGIATNSPREILLGRDFEQVANEATDTTVYSVKKLCHMLAQNNPNIMEMFGLNPEQILLSSEIYRMIRENTEIFLSKRCAYTFGGYANQQLRRLETKSARSAGQGRKEKYILSSIQDAEHVFRERFAKIEEDKMKLYLDASEKEGFEKEIFLDVTLSHYPLRDFSSLLAEYRQVVTGYDKLGKRNQHAMDKDKLGKHMMHLFRLYHMAFEILEDGIIRTYREKDHDWLMDIRNGMYLDDDRQVLPEFYEIVEEYDERLKKDAAATSLPEQPNQEAIDNLLIEINTMILDTAKETAAD